jgi:hypothetical protein
LPPAAAGALSVLAPQAATSAARTMTSNRMLQVGRIEVIEVLCSQSCEE